MTVEPRRTATDRVAIRPGTIDDVAHIARLLRLLADSLDGLDDHRSTAETIQRDGFGRSPLFHTFLAEPADGVGDPIALCVYLADYSTTRARAGVYVLDLVVDPNWRGSGVGLDLLRTVAEAGRRKWDADYLILSVDTANHRARRFYQRHGMVIDEKSNVMTLDGLASFLDR